MQKNQSSRELAVEALQEILSGGKYIHHVLDSMQSESQLTLQDQKLVVKLVKGTVENIIKIDYILSQFLQSKTRVKPYIRQVLRVGVYQLVMLQMAEHAVCNEAVEMVKKRGLTPLTGFVNGVLRNVARQKDQITWPKEGTLQALSIQYSMPEFILKILLEQYTMEQTVLMLQNFLSEQPVSLRINNHLLKREFVIESLKSECQIIESALALECVHVESIGKLDQLKAFQKGWITVQDESSIVMGNAIPLTKEMTKIVDMCAAPGGKSTHIASRMKQINPKATIEARDLYLNKLNRIEENAQRMRLDNLSYRIWDATEVDETLINQCDVLLLDVPCSGLGIIGKKPDIKYALKEQTFKDLVNLQQNILKACAHYPKVGSYLVYSTCTVNKEENEAQIQWFLEHYDYEAVGIENTLYNQLTDQKSVKHIQFLPGVMGTDGFFFAILKRKS